MKSIMTPAIAAGLFLLCIQNRVNGDTRLNRARMDVKSLEQAVTAYWLRTGEWPSSLEILTKRSPDGSPALLKDAFAIIDPWNQPYRYDPNQLSPESGRPLIWSDGPPGESNGIIANWGSTYKSPNYIPLVAIALWITMVALFVCWVLPRSEKEQWRNAQSLAGWLLVALVLGAAFCFVSYSTMLGG